MWRNYYHCTDYGVMTTINYVRSVESHIMIMYRGYIQQLKQSITAQYCMIMIMSLLTHKASRECWISAHFAINLYQPLFDYSLHLVPSKCIFQSVSQ